MVWVVLWYWLLITTQVFCQQENCHCHAWNKIHASHQFLVITYLINWQHADWYVNVILKHWSHYLQVLIKGFFSHTHFIPCAIFTVVLSYRKSTLNLTHAFFVFRHPFLILFSTFPDFETLKLAGINLLTLYLTCFQVNLPRVTALSLSVFLWQKHA